VKTGCRYPEFRNILFRGKSSHGPEFRVFFSGKIAVGVVAV